MADLSYDVAVVGAGHNGLTLACYLARAGLTVGVFELAEHVGGGASLLAALPLVPGDAADAAVLSQDAHRRDLRDRRCQGVDRADGGPGRAPLRRRGRVVHGDRLLRRRA